jgi:hypothetical protein
MNRGYGAGGQRGVSNNGLGVGMGIVRIGKNHALVYKHPESAFAKDVRIAVEQISTQCIHSDLEYQSRVGGRVGGGGLQRRQCATCSQPEIAYYPCPSRPCVPLPETLHLTFLTRLIGLAQPVEYGEFKQDVALSSA